MLHRSKGISGVAISISFILAKDPNTPYCHIERYAIHGSTRITECVRLFISDDFVNRFGSTTNSPLTAAASLPTEPAEMRTFLWLRFYMGIVEMPRLKLFWYEDEFYSNNFVPQCMHRDRILTVQRALSFDLGALEEIILHVCTQYLHLPGWSHWTIPWSRQVSSAHSK